MNHRICLVLYLLSAIIYINASDITVRMPGNLTVLNKATLSLQWTVSATDDQIKWCYWKYRPDANLGTKRTKLIGWDNTNKKQIPYPSNLKGWEFLSDQPCSSGIKKVMVTPDYQGLYEFVVVMLPADNEHVSQPSFITVQESTDLTYTVGIDTTKYILTVGVPSKTLAPINVTSGDIVLSASMDWPDSAGNITFEKVVSDDIQHAHTCSTNRKCEKEIGIDHDEEKVKFRIVIIPSMQGSSRLELEQPVFVLAAASTINIVAIVLGVLLIIVLIVVIGILCRKRKIRRKLPWYSNHRNRTNIAANKSDADMESQKTDTPLNEAEHPIFCIEDLQKKLEDAQEQENKLIKTVGELNEENERKTTEAEKLQRDIKERDEDIINLNSIISDLQLKNEEKDKKLADIITEAASKSGWLSSIFGRKKPEDVVAENTKLTDRVKELEGNVSDLEKENKDITDEWANDLETQRRQFEAKKGELLRPLMKENSDLRDQVTSLNKSDEVASLKNERDKIKAERDALKEEVGRLNKGPLVQAVSDQGLTANKQPPLHALGLQNKADDKTKESGADRWPAGPGSAIRQGKVGETSTTTEPQQPDVNTDVPMVKETSPTKGSGVDPEEPVGNSVNENESHVAADGDGELISRLDKIIEEFVRLRGEYGLPLLKDKAQEMLQDIDEELKKIDGKMTKENEYKITTYKRQVSTTKRLVETFIRDTTPLGISFTELNKFDPTLAEMYGFQQQYNNVDQPERTSELKPSMLDKWEKQAKLMESQITGMFALSDKIRRMSQQLQGYEQSWKSSKQLNSDLTQEAAHTENIHSHQQPSGVRQPSGGEPYLNEPPSHAVANDWNKYPDT